MARRLRRWLARHCVPRLRINQGRSFKMHSINKSSWCTALLSERTTLQTKLLWISAKNISVLFRIDTKKWSKYHTSSGSGSHIRWSMRIVHQRGYVEVSMCSTLHQTSRAKCQPSIVSLQLDKRRQTPDRPVLQCWAALNSKWYEEPMSHQQHL